MKIQAINNQNNINHKAYFKPNAEFMKEEGLMQILSRFNLYRDSDFFKLEDKKTDIDCLDILTKKD